MPLQESFGKKSNRNEPTSSAKRNRVLTSAPGLEDLRYTLLTAQSSVRQPIVMVWKRTDGAGGYLLTVTRNSEENYDPTWMLHADEGNNSTNIVWSYTTSDADLIHSLLTEEVKREGPAAVIPDSLRPQAPVQEMTDLLGSAEPNSDPQFFENYQILQTIGRGGMGIIYKARRKADDSVVALKVLRMDLLLDQVSVRRFEHEATAASSLMHPNLIRVREFGLSRYGQPYLTMDYLDGVELQNMLTDCDHLDLPTFVNIFTQICDALAYAHEKGLIHRDLKPGNIMLVKGPTGVDTVKIIDFGIAKMLREQNRQPNITTTGEMLGSPAYMSPEQCGGVVLDCRSDIYSLGCVMYEAISGMLPFRTDSAIGTIMMQVNDQAQPFRTIRPDLNIPEELQRIIFKALEKDPANRYQNASELSDDLWAFAAMGYPSQSPMSATLEMDALPKELLAEAFEQEALHAVHEGIEPNILSDRAFTLMRRAGALPNALLESVVEVDRLISEGHLSLDQGVQVIQATQKGMPLQNALTLLSEGKLSIFGSIRQNEQ
jgi:serine/threonine protein kinase